MVANLGIILNQNVCYSLSTAVELISKWEIHHAVMLSADSDNAFDNTEFFAILLRSVNLSFTIQSSIIL